MAKRRLPATRGAITLGARTRRAAQMSFRNRRGEETEVPMVSATEAKNEFGRVLELAQSNGAVAIMRHETPRGVLLSVEEFEALMEAKRPTLNTLRQEFDAMFEGMQTPAARAAMRAAFDASGDELGKAAVAAARKRKHG
jgi:antitoxin Phd